METFEPVLWLIVKKGEIPVLAESYNLEYVPADTFKEDDAIFKFISTMLVEAGEPPLSKEEIFYHKLTKDY